MSLINDASLVLTPNSVKEGKLYSIIPSNGNGDMTVVRATGATRTNELGLIEPTPYNLVTYSEMFSDILWTKQSVSITPNTTTAPNNTLTADTLSNDGTNAFHFLSQNASFISGSTYTTSIFAKKGTNNFLQIVGASAIYSSATVFANFDLNNGITGSVGAGTTSTITNFGNGWYRCTITATATVTATAAGILLNIITSSTSPRAESNTLSTSVFLWGAQLVQGSVPKDYFYTTNRLNVPRLNYDSVGGCPSILVEPQRTNLTNYSEMFSDALWVKNASSISINTTNSPSGSLTADTLIDTSVNAIHRLRFGVSLSSLTNYTLSVYAKKNTLSFFQLALINTLDSATSSRVFDLQNGVLGEQLSTATLINSSITNVGNDWYRCSITASLPSNPNQFQITLATLATGNLTTANQVTYLGSGNGSIFLWGTQLEAGSYVTSYIPTVATATTRNADLITRNNIYTNGLITSLGGTWFIELNNNLSLTRDSVGNGIWIGDNNTLSIAGNSFNIRNNGGGATRLSINKCIAGSLTGLYTTLTNTVKIAIDWNGTTADVFVNGVKVVTGTAFTTTNMEFLNSQAGDVQKYIKSMMLFPRPLTDAECIALTSYFFNSYLDMAKYLNYTIQ